LLGVEDGESSVAGVEGFPAVDHPGSVPCLSSDVVAGTTERGDGPCRSEVGTRRPRIPPRPVLVADHSSPPLALPATAAVRNPL
jgi:hypothetical protein